MTELKIFTFYNPSRIEICHYVITFDLPKAISILKEVYRPKYDFLPDKADELNRVGPFTVFINPVEAGIIL